MKREQQLLLDGLPVNTWDEMVAAYHKRIENFGIGHKALFYPNETLHMAKLAHISRIAQTEISACDSVLDVGCGTGDLVPFMPICDYKGVDLVDKFIEEAHNRYPHLKFDCINVLDITEGFDWLILAGMMGSVPQPEKLLKKAWELANKGVVVDFIDILRYQGYLNSYKMGDCTDFFISLGVRQLKLYPMPRHNWTVFVAHKQSLWL